MTRHWKGIITFIVISMLAFAISLMTNSFVFGIGLLLAALTGFAVYMMGESDFKTNPYEHPHHHADKPGASGPGAR